MKILIGIIGIIGGLVTFVVWCCAKIGATQDHEGLYGECGRSN